MGTNVMTPSGYGVGGRRLRAFYGSSVDKFGIDENYRATHLDVVVRGRTKRIHVKKQIVLAANALFTPGILERSGVGNPSILSQYDIPVRVPSPQVGENLQTDIGSLFMIATNDTVAFNQEGLTGQALLSILAEFNGTRAIQLLQLPFPTVPGSEGNLAGDLVGAYNLSAGFSVITHLISNILPASRGNVHISGTDPQRFPNVNFNLYSDSTNRDLRSIVATLQVLYQVVLNLRTLNPTLSYQLLMPQESYFSSVPRLTEYVLNSPFLQYHYSSSASMGPVLNNRLGVVGLTNVMVADTSAWPIKNNGNTREQALRTAAYAASYLMQTTPV
jgi:choline dehydrogenase-like flavoprotein